MPSSWNAGTTGRSGARGVTVALLVGALVAPHTPLAAQTVRGTVTDNTDRPVPGAVVALLDSTQASVVRVLTDERGTFRMIAPRAGTYRLRTARIGARPVVSAPFVLGAGETRDESVRIALISFGLDTVRVASRSVCRTRASDSTQVTFQLWEQVRTALTAAQLTAAARVVTATTAHVARVLEPGRLRRVREQDIGLRTERVTQPWRSLGAAELHQRGYVDLENSDGSVTYFAPDLDALLSSYFLDDHCLRIAEGRDSSEVGIAFEPTPTRRMPEIAGTLYLDRVSTALRALTYRYVQVPPNRAEFAGGDLEFVPLRNGAWMIARWEIRMPALEQVNPRAPVRVAAVTANGGDLLVARVGTDTLWRRPPVPLRGVVVDSLTRRPVAGARVAAALGASATTDARGEFRLAEVVPGTVTLDVRTASLDSLGAVHRHIADVVDSVARVSIALPTLAQVVGSICGTLGPARGVVIGRVIYTGMSDTAALPAEVQATMPVVADWVEPVNDSTGLSYRTRRLQSRSGSDGRFRLCGAPLGALLTVRALPARGRATTAFVRLDAATLAASTRLTVDSTAAAVASFTGLVVAADSAGRPLLDAEIEIEGTTLRGRTARDGQFRIDDIPVGTHVVRVRRLGFSPMTASITFTANEDESRRLVLDRVTVLDSIAIRAEAILPSFEDNRRVGLGKFITREEMATMENRTLGALLTSFNGARLVSAKRGSGMWLVRNRGQQSIGGADRHAPSMEDSVRGARPDCYAHVWVDGRPVYLGRNQEPLYDVAQIAPSQIEALEYYASAAQTPAQYSGLNSTCGVLVIWTRRTFDPPKKKR